MYSQLILEPLRSSFGCVVLIQVIEADYWYRYVVWARLWCKFFQWWISVETGGCDSFGGRPAGQKGHGVADTVKPILSGRGGMGHSCKSSVFVCLVLAELIHSKFVATRRTI